MPFTREFEEEVERSIDEAIKQERGEGATLAHAFTLRTFKSADELIKHMRASFFRNIKGEYRTVTAYTICGHVVDPIIYPIGEEIVERWRAVVVVDDKEEELGTFPYEDLDRAMKKIDKFVRYLWRKCHR